MFAWRITLDTNILISASLWERSSCSKLLQKFLEDDVSMFTSFAILDEFIRVLKRDFPDTGEEAKNRIQFIIKMLTVVYPETMIDIIKEDPSDNKILECAVASNSDYVITYDKHLLTIKEFQGIKIVTPEVMLKAIE